MVLAVLSYNLAEDVMEVSILSGMQDSGTGHLFEAFIIFMLCIGPMAF